MVPFMLRINDAYNNRSNHLCIGYDNGDSEETTVLIAYAQVAMTAILAKLLS